MSESQKTISAQNHFYKVTHIFKVKKQFYFLKDFIYLFLERGEGREKERERNVDVWLLLMHSPLETWPTTQARARIGNRTGNLLVCRPALNPLSYTGQDKKQLYF